MSSPLTRSRSASPVVSRPGSRPGSRSNSRPGSRSKESFKPAGKATYEDKFLLWDEEEMAKRPGSGSPTPTNANLRRASPFGDDETGEGAIGEGKAGEAGEEGVAPFEITAWDETWEKEAERLIKNLRLSLKEARDRVDQLVGEKREMQREMNAMQDLFLERRQVAEDALMALEQLKTGKGDGSMPVRKLAGDRDDKGSASWRDDRARMGARIEELEGVERDLRDDLAARDASVAEQSAVIKDLQERLSRSEQHASAQSATIKGLEGSIESMTRSIDDDNNTIATLHTELEEKEKAITERVANAAGEAGAAAAELKTRVEALQTELDKKTEVSKGQEEEIARLTREWEELQQYLESGEGGSDASSLAEIAGLKKEVSALRASLENGEKELHTLADDLAREQALAKKQEEQIVEKDRINIEYEGIVGDLQSEVSEGQTRIEAMDVQLEAKRAEVAAIIERHQAQVARLTALQEEQAQAHQGVLSDRDGQLARKEKELEEKAAVVSQLEAHVQGLEGQNEEQATQLASLRRQALDQAAQQASEREQAAEKLAEWEKKMSLFDILTEYEANAKQREQEYEEKIGSLAGELRGQTAQRDYWHAKYRRAQDQYDMSHNDAFYLELLDRERRLTARLMIEINEHNVRAEQHRDEMVALNRARELELVDYETRLRVSIQGTMQQLRLVLAEKTINESLLRSLLARLESHAEEARSLYLSEIAQRDDLIKGLRGEVAAEQERVQEMQGDVQDKEVELVRVLAENSDFRLKDVERKRQVTEAIGESLSQFEDLVLGGQEVNARAPRLRLQQTEALLKKTQETAKRWEKIAREYMLEPHLAHDQLHAGGRGGFVLDLHSIESMTSAHGAASLGGMQLGMMGSSLAGAQAGVCLQAITESVLGSTALRMVQSQGVTNESLSALRAWMEGQAISEVQEERALERVCLSWASLEALCDLKLSARLYASHTQAQDKAQALQALSSSQDLQERLFVLFEHGNVTTAEFRALHELKMAFGLSPVDLTSALGQLGLPSAELVERCMQDTIDRHEVCLSKAALFEVQVLAAQLGGVGMDCEKGLGMYLARLRSDLDEACALREEYAVLRKSYNGANTQIQLLTDVRDKLMEHSTDDGNGAGSASVLSARVSARSSRGTMIHSRHLHHHSPSQAGDDMADAYPDNILHPSSSSVGNHEAAAAEGGGEGEGGGGDAASLTSAAKHHIQSLRQVVKTERRRRQEEAQARQMVSSSGLGDYGTLCRADVRNSKLLYHTSRNLTALEVQLSEQDSLEHDKARIVFVKLLRHRLQRESAVCAEKAKMYSRAQYQEAQSERYLLQLEEAMAIMSTAGLKDAPADDEDSLADVSLHEKMGTAGAARADVAAMIKKQVSGHIGDLQQRLGANTDRLDADTHALHEALNREQQRCARKYRQAQQQQQVLLAAEEQTNDESNYRQFKVTEGQVRSVLADMGAGDSDADVDVVLPPIQVEPSAEDIHAYKQLSREVKVALATLQAIVADIRRKDSSLERLRHVLHGIEGGLIDKDYRHSLPPLQIALSAFEVVGADALGAAHHELLSGKVSWSPGVVPSLDSELPAPPVPSVAGSGVKVKMGEDEDVVMATTGSSDDSEIPESEPEPPTQSEPVHVNADSPGVGGVGLSPTAAAGPKGVPPLPLGASNNSGNSGKSSKSGPPPSPSRMSLPGSAKKIHPSLSSSPPASMKSENTGTATSAGARRARSRGGPSDTQTQGHGQEQDKLLAVKKKPGGQSGRDEAFLEELRQMKQELLTEMQQQQQQQQQQPDVGGGKSSGCVVM